MTQTRTAGEAGWRVSRYNLRAEVPGVGRVAIANLFKGTCAEYTPMELFLLSVLDRLDENHPAIERFAKRGIIVNFDERACLEFLGRAVAAHPARVDLTICPTTGCNFDCPYCFEDHTPGKMDAQVQDDVVALARRMLETSGAKRLSVTWFGGEPLLAADVIEALSPRLIALAESYGADYVADIITNGYLLDGRTAEMLGRAKVKKAQVTLDGIGSVHDATRHLAGGGATFDRIVDNISRPGLSLHVDVRHNIHEGNRDQAPALRALVERLAAESGNELVYDSVSVERNAVAQARGSRVGLLCAADEGQLAAARDAENFRAARGHFCGAHSIWGVGIDDKGRLQKCWEAVDKPQLSFGRAHDWDPADPLATADNPDMLTCFLNTAAPIADDECAECVWLPACRGGCPYRRLFDGGKQCVSYRDDPESYVLALHARIGA